MANVVKRQGVVSTSTTSTPTNLVEKMVVSSSVDKELVNHHVQSPGSFLTPAINTRLIIVDARPLLNAQANSIMGKGLFDSCLLH